MKLNSKKKNMNNENILFAENTEKYNFPTMGNKKVLVVGIGGGSDVVGAFGIARFLQESNPNAKISYAVSVSPKTNYEGFEKLSDWLYKRKNHNKLEIADELHHTLSLVVKMQEFDKNEQPLLIVRPKYKEKLTVKEHQEQVTIVFKETLNILNTDVIIAVDGGGDSLTGGVSDNVETEFDRTGVRALQEFGKPFTYIVIGPGCDGESTIEMLKGAVKHENENNSFLGHFDLSPFIEKWEKLSSKLLKDDRTPNIMRLANNEIKNNPKIINELQAIERHRKPKIPLKWLITGLVFNGISFTGKFKEDK